MTPKLQSKFKLGTPIPEASNLATLRATTGLVGRFKATARAKRQAEKAYSDLMVSEVQGQAHAASIGIATVEAQVVGILAGHAQRTVGVIVEEAAMEAGAMDVRYSSLADAEVLTHIANRDETYRALSQRVGSGAVSETEAETVRQLADGRLATNVERTVQRNETLMEVNQRLFAGVTNAVIRSFDRIG